MVQHHDPSTDPVAWNHGLRSIEEYFAPDAPFWREIDANGFLRDPNTQSDDADGRKSISESVGVSQISFPGRTGSGFGMQAGEESVIGRGVPLTRLGDESNALAGHFTVCTPFTDLIRQTALNALQGVFHRIPVHEGPSSPMVVIAKDELTGLSDNKITTATGDAGDHDDDSEDTIAHGGGDEEGDSSETDPGEDTSKASEKALDSHHKASSRALQLPRCEGRICTVARSKAAHR